MSRSKQQVREAVFLHLYKTEQVVRLESERREAKARLRLMDAMTDALNDQLLYVAQFKKQWLQHRLRLEEERCALMDAEEEWRAGILEEGAAELKTVVRRYDPKIKALTRQ